MLFAEEREPGKIAINLKTQPHTHKKKKKVFQNTFTNALEQWYFSVLPETCVKRNSKILKE